MAEDKVITLRPNELPNLVSSYHLDDHNYLQWARYIRTTLKGRTPSVTEYYRTLNGLWIKLDQYQGLKMCKIDSIAYTGLVERRRIFKFLHGLNSEYNPIRSEET
ncbi:hypothetical protein CR513_38720, partial [Mucuna pruriens]